MITIIGLMSKKVSFLSITQCCNDSTRLDSTRLGALYWLDSKLASDLTRARCKKTQLDSTRLVHDSTPLLTRLNSWLDPLLTLSTQNRVDSTNHVLTYLDSRSKHHNVMWLRYLGIGRLHVSLKLRNFKVPQLPYFSTNFQQVFTVLFTNVYSFFWNSVKPVRISPLICVSIRLPDNILKTKFHCDYLEIR